MDISDTIALIISFCSLVYSIYTNYKSKHLQKRLEELQRHSFITSKFAELEYHIASNPNILRFHGISFSDLEKCQLNFQDFAYFIASFTLAFSDYIYLNNKDEMFQSGSYRYNMFKTKEMRRAWPVVRRMFSDGGNSDFLKKIDRLCKELDDVDK